jgi:hypothetical protein
MRKLASAFPFSRHRSLRRATVREARPCPRCADTTVPLSCRRFSAGERGTDDRRLPSNPGGTPGPPPAPGRLLPPAGTDGATTRSTAVSAVQPSAGRDRPHSASGRRPLSGRRFFAGRGARTIGAHRPTRARRPGYHRPLDDCCPRQGRTAQPPVARPSRPCNRPRGGIAPIRRPADAPVLPAVLSRERGPDDRRPPSSPGETPGPNATAPGARGSGPKIGRV